MKLVLVRHGEVVNPFGNPDALYGCLDVELSEKGEEEAKRAGEWVRRHGVDVVMHSGLKRARFGAEAVGVGKGVEEAGFRELDRGEWAGMTAEQIESGNPNFQSRLATDPDFRPENGENFHDLHSRVASAFTRLAATHPTSTVCIVCHNWVIRCFVAASLSLPLTAYYDIPIPTASITVIDYDSFDEQNILKGKIISQGVKP